MVEEPATLQLFLDYYKTTTPPLSNVALECLVRQQGQKWGLNRLGREVPESALIRMALRISFCMSLQGVQIECVA